MSNLFFKNNFANDAGSVLYGSEIGNCKLTHGVDSHSFGEVFNMIVHNNDTYYNTTSKISTDPIQIYAPVKTIFQTVLRSVMFHTQCILVKHFRFLWLQLDKEMEQLIAK